MIDALYTLPLILERKNNQSAHGDMGPLALLNQGDFIYDIHENDSQGALCINFQLS